MLELKVSFRDTVDLTLLISQLKDYGYIIDYKKIGRQFLWISSQTISMQMALQMLADYV